MPSFKDSLETTDTRVVIDYLREQMYNIARSIGTSIPINDPITLSSLNTSLPSDRGPAYQLMRHIYDWILTKANNEPPEGYDSWPEYNLQMVKTYDELLEFKFIESKIKVVKGVFPDETNPSIFKDFNISIVSAFGEDYPYFLQYNNPNFDHEQNRERSIRLYITIDPGENLKNIGSTAVYFAQLCDQLQKGGIKFNAKVTSPSGTANRMDNIIIYADVSQLKELREIALEFVRTNRTVANTLHVSSAFADPDVGGISWAVEPNDDQIQRFQRLFGKDNASYTELVAFYALPYFLNRLISEHERLGNSVEAYELSQVLKLVTEATK